MSQKPAAARLYGVLNYDMAISDTLDRTYVLERGCGVCVGKRTIFGTVSNLLGCPPHVRATALLLLGGFGTQETSRRKHASPESA